MLEVELFVQVFVTVLVIVDPVGNVPVFLVLTRRSDVAARRRAAWQATAVASSLTILFAVLGQQILTVLGISLPSLQIAGGLLLILVALSLLGPDVEPDGDHEEGRNLALVPLGTPLLAGPGAIAATMVYWQRADSFLEQLTVIAALLGDFGVVYLALRYSTFLVRVLKENGIRLISQVFGLLLSAIAIELVASGVSQYVTEGV